MMLTDNTGILPKWTTHTQTLTHKCPTGVFRRMNSQHRVFNPTFPLRKGKTSEPPPSSFYSYFYFISTLSSRFLLSDPLFINLSSAAASAALNWWAEAVSHTEVTVHTYTCIDAERVILAGLHAQSQLAIMWLLLPASHPHDPIRSPDLSNQLLWQPAGRRADRGSRAVPIS